MLTFRPTTATSKVRLVHRTYITTSVSLESRTELPLRSILFTGLHKHPRRGDKPKRVDGLTQFERDVLANPYARMLASPIRKCIYSDKNLPNAFMVRFIIAREKPTNHHRIVSTIERESFKGSGWWIKASAAYLKAFHDEGKYKRISSAALFRSDIHSHIRDLLQSQALSIFSQTVSKAITLKTDEHKARSPLFIPLRRHGEILEPADTSVVRGLQCAIQIPTGDYRKVSKFPRYQKVSYKRCSNLETIEARIPVYDICEFWEPEAIQQVKSIFEIGVSGGLADNWQVGDNENIIVGVVSDVRTVKLAISLWQMKCYG